LVLREIDSYQNKISDGFKPVTFAKKEQLKYAKLRKQTLAWFGQIFGCEKLWMKFFAIH